jgi:hypothetical protein
MVSVRAVLAMPELWQTACAGKAGLGRPISRIYGTGLRDPGRYLSGGELAISGECPLRTEWLAFRNG